MTATECTSMAIAAAMLCLQMGDPDRALGILDPICADIPEGVIRDAVLGVVKKIRSTTKAKATREAKRKDPPSLRPLAKMLEERIGRALRFQEIAGLRSLLIRWAHLPELIEIQVKHSATGTAVDSFFVTKTLDGAGRAMAATTDRVRSSTRKEWVPDEPQG